MCIGDHLVELRRFDQHQRLAIEMLVDEITDFVQGTIVDIRVRNLIGDDADTFRLYRRGLFGCFDEMLEVNRWQVEMTIDERQRHGLGFGWRIR